MSRRQTVEEPEQLVVVQIPEARLLVHCPVCGKPLRCAVNLSNVEKNPTSLYVHFHRSYVVHNCKGDDE